MIYLIDDNQGDLRRNHLNIHFVDDRSFSDVLTSIERLKIGEDLKFLEPAACLLVHRTTEDCNENGDFIAGSRTNVDFIIEDISEKGDKIPIVIFSNSMSEIAEYDYNYHPYVIYGIKKNVFYSNLFDFLVHYQQSRIIDLRLIAYGRRFKSSVISTIFNQLTKCLDEYPKSDNFKSSYVDLNVLKDFLELSGIKISLNEFLIKLEDEPITIEKFTYNLSLIIESINEYEENIYDWPD
jgi:hypothetical protein